MIKFNFLTDPRPFVTQKEISESRLNDDAYRNIDLGDYNSPTNMLIKVGVVIQNGTLEEAELNSTFYANDITEIISVRNLHVVYTNRPAMNYMLQFDFCELQQWTSKSSRFNLRTDLSRQQAAVMTSYYFISSKYISANNIRIGANCFLMQNTRLSRKIIGCG